MCSAVLPKPTTIILSWVDAHDKAYAKARRISFVLRDGAIQIVENAEATPSNSRSDVQTRFPELLLQKHSDQELSTMGIPISLLPQLRKLTEINQLEQFEKELSTDAYDRLLNVVWPDTVRTPAVTDGQLSKRLEQDSGQQDFALIASAEEFDRALEGSIQEWMIFLHPSQKQIVEASFSGPARIKGVAGSGKTVVALHRARFLAKTASATEKVLFLTYSNRLAGVAGELFTLLCGNAPERPAIEVRTLHSWCLRFLGNEVHISSPEDRRAAFFDAIETARKKQPESKLAKFSQNFVEEEIGAVIQGRALGNEEKYMVLKRIGRGSPLTDEDRKSIFMVYKEYKRLLAPKIDFNELILLTLERLEKESQSLPYHAVVVDEIQDLSESAMRVIKCIAGTGPNKLLLIGDGQQQIYRAGFSLKEIGIEIVGRSRILRQNYRNTKQVLEAAYSMIKDLNFDDLGEDGAPALYSPEYAPRDGGKPILKGFASAWNEQKWLAVEIQRLLSSKSKLFSGDIAILARTRQKLMKCQDMLRKLGFSTCFLSRDNVKDYLDQGTLKLITMHSAKGLEFKVVFVMGLSNDEFPFSSKANNLSGDEDALEREQRLLYVAMTRARDQLFMSYVGQPSEFVQRIDPSLRDAQG
jgi:superfamily I DNA/RNA helicase